MSQFYNSSRCVVVGCRSTYTTIDKHYFPRKFKRSGHLWVEVLNNPVVRSVPYADLKRFDFFVCAKHFEESSYVTVNREDKTFKRLKKGAVPALALRLTEDGEEIVEPVPEVIAVAPQQRVDPRPEYQIYSERFGPDYKGDQNGETSDAATSENESDMELEYELSPEEREQMKLDAEERKCYDSFLHGYPKATPVTTNSEMEFNSFIEETKKSCLDSNAPYTGPELTTLKNIDIQQDTPASDPAFEEEMPRSTHIFAKGDILVKKDNQFVIFREDKEIEELRFILTSAPKSNEYPQDNSSVCYTVENVYELPNGGVIFGFIHFLKNLLVELPVK